MKTLLMIKPDIVENGLYGEIIALVLRNRFTITNLRMVSLDTETAGRFYEVHQAREFFPSLVEYISSGPVIAIEIRVTMSSPQSAPSWGRPIRRPPHRERSVTCMVSLYSTTRYTLRTRRERRKKSLQSCSAAPKFGWTASQGLVTQRVSAMILELDKLPAATEQITADEMVGFEDVDGHENQIDCHIGVSIRRVADSFFIHAELDGRFDTICHRCLESTKYNVNSSFDLVVKKLDTSVAPPGTDPDDSGDEALIYLPAGENELSLDHLIYESLIAEIPIQIRCSDECKGLCPICGTNLNRGSCDCEPETDSRWDALRSLRRQEDTSSE